MNVERLLKHRVDLVISIIASVTLLLFTALQWWLIDWLTVFLIPFAYLAVLIFFAATFVFVAIKSGLNMRQEGWKALAPVFACVAALLLWLCVPFTRLWIDFNFWYYRAARRKCCGPNW